MRYLAATIIIVVLSAFAVFAAGRWDGSFQYAATLTSTDAGPTQLATVGGGAYIKVKCPNDTFVGTSSDAGFRCNNGFCDQIKFATQGEVFYSQMIATEKYVNALQADGGAASCILSVAK